MYTSYKVMKKFLFLFFLISQKNILRSAEGATLSTQGVYKGELGGIGKKEEKIRKTNHPWGQPAHCPGEKGKKEKVEEFLNRPRGVLIFKAPVDL
jgi:hypothetical protein